MNQSLDSAQSNDCSSLKDDALNYLNAGHSEAYLPQTILNSDMILFCFSISLSKILEGVSPIGSVILI